MKELLVIAAAILLFWTSGLRSQERPSDGPPPLDSLPLRAQLVFNLGSSGLLQRLNSYESFASTQGRLGLSRAQIQASRAPGGPKQGFEDSSTVISLPFEAFVALPNSEGMSFLRLGGLFSDVNGKGGNLTEVDSETKRLDFQYFYAPNTTTLLGGGVYYERADIDIVSNGGDVVRAGWGLRSDVLSKFSLHWGLAARADINFGDNETRVPTPAGTFSLDQDDTRLYGQIDLIGNYTARDFEWMPMKWAFQPNVTAVYQRTEYDDAIDSNGRLVRGTVGSSEDYATVGIGARFVRQDFRPFVLNPYFEVGYDREIKNDLDLTLDEPDIASVSLGASMVVGRSSRLDVDYNRQEGLDGKRNVGILTLRASVSF